MADIHLPQLGESVTEGTLTRWLKQIGDHVTEQEPLFEVSTDKVDSEVPSPASGRLTEVLVGAGETVDVGTVLARLDTVPANGAPAPSAAPGPAPGAAPAQAPPPPPPPPPPLGTPAASPLLSPAVRLLVDQHGLDVAQLPASGRGGRITRADAEAAVRDGIARIPEGASRPLVAPLRTAPPAAPAPPAPPAPPAASAATRDPEQRSRPTLEPGDRVEPFSNVRRLTAAHMVRSKTTSPHAYTTMEVSYDAVDRARLAAREAWRREEGFSLTYLPFVARAIIDGLAAFPRINATVGDDELVVRSRVNLAFAVDLDFDALVAPVIHDTGDLRLRPLARALHDKADRARTKRLSVDDLSSGTFTISNSGSFGTHLVLPIINQPQVAILSTDGVSRKPVVITAPDGSEAIGIQPVGVLGLSWDHRAFDGAYAAAFLRRVKEIMETRDWSTEL